jgi:hypothetical protein
VAFLALFPGATGAHCAAKFLAPVGSSLEQEVQRLAPAIAAAGHHRSGPNPNFRHKPIAGKPLSLLLPFPGRPLKDRYGEPERGSEWEPIKILLEGDGGSNKMNTASNTRLRLTTQVGQDHIATGVLLALGTNHQHHRPKNVANTRLEPY